MNRYGSARFLAAVLTVLSVILFVAGGLLGLVLGVYAHGNVALVGIRVANWPQLLLIGLGVIVGLLTGMLVALPFLVASELLNVLSDVAEHSYHTRKEIERMRRRV